MRTPELLGFFVAAFVAAFGFLGSGSPHLGMIGFLILAVFFRGFPVVFLWSLGSRP